MRIVPFAFRGLVLMLALGRIVSGQPVRDSLAEGFKAPPNSALPRTWWHWTMSNVTPEGITKELEWMKRSGIGGFMLADVNVGGGQDVPTKIPYGTPQWYEAVRFAATEAQRLGLEMGIFSSPGWSETGGPWVKPQEAMKKLVWSETSVTGPTLFQGKLVAPPSNNGQIRNTGATYYAQGGGDPTYYADSAVLAFRTPAGEQEAVAAHPLVTTNEGPVDGSALLDDQLDTRLTIPAPKSGGPAWVQFEFPQPFLARANTLGGRGGSANGIPVGRVLASDEGKNFRSLVTLPGAQLYRQSMVRTYAFAPTTAKYYRIEMSGAPLGPAATMSQAPSEPATEYVLSEAVLHGGARVNRWEEKAGFGFLFEYKTVPTAPVPASATIAPEDVIDLTSQMKPDGTLGWKAPPGQWTVLRLGYSLTGAKNRPATPAGSGFEADKLSREYMTAYFHGYFDPLKKALGPLVGATLKYVMMDSWEAGTNNWTDHLLDDFQKRRGYDPRPYLPVLTGRVVGTAEMSDRFTWDFRRTLADLWAENHYGTMADLLRQDGVGICAEASGVSLEMPEDTLLNKSKVEIPAGEFWVRDLHPRLMYLQEVRGAASATNVYGKPLTATESFTGGGYESPYTLKKIGDYWFSQGTNRIMFHTSAHQPLDTKPGNTMVGTHLNRNMTWAEQALPYMTYLARQSYLLQQGKFVADLAYLLDEGAPSTPPIWASGTVPAPPEGYDYDFINADVLLHRMTVSADGRLTLPDGMSYRALILPLTDRMRPELLRQIRTLVQGGAIVIGPRPRSSPSLAGYPAADQEVAALAEEIWGDLDGASRTIRRVGKGSVYWGWPLERALAMESITPDFQYEKALDANLAWLHRRTADADIYYVANLTDASRQFAARFRVTGRQAEVWHPDTGAIEPAGYQIENGTTTVPLSLGEHESTFVVFRHPAAGVTERTLTPTTTTALLTVAGPWEVKFPPHLGAPAELELKTLHSWTAESDPAVKYFSGTAVYTKTLTAPREWFRTDQALLLDLGRVGDLAEVSINGRPLGILWKPPYRVDVSAALRPGDNQIEIKITNQWTNRIAGDRLLPDAQKILGPGPGRLATSRPGQAPMVRPLPEAGLLGPVTLLTEPAHRVTDLPDGLVASIPANYTEAKVGTYVLPDPLKLTDGSPVRDAQTWFAQRRPEIVRLFEDNQFGRMPERPKDMSFDVFDHGTPAFEGNAVRKQVTIHFTNDPQGPKLDLVLYLPPAATGPVPVLLNISFSANDLAVIDPGVKPGMRWDPESGRRVPAAGGRTFGRLNVLPTLERGIGIATFNYADVDPDALGGLAQGIRALYLKPGATAPGPDEWGSISAWAWGISRVVDYFETDPSVDAKRIAILGVSRLGKTVLWAGGHDPRIALVIANCSGEGGAALSRRNYGETIAHLVAPTRYPYQFAANYAKWGPDPNTSPVDANLLVALMAPRPLLLQTGNTDTWSDPKGEFLSALAARPVYELLGAQGPASVAFPPPGQRVGDALSYYMHEGGHGTVPSDWAVFLDFIATHLADRTASK